MRIQKAFLGIALSAGLLTAAATASANPPADDFLNPQKGRPHLTLMPFIGPGFRAIYDHRFEIEKDMSEVRTQIMGTVAVPFAEVSANVDVRFFLNSLGGAIGYHNEWHMLQFNPDPLTGRDRLGEPAYQATTPDPKPGRFELDREARLVKDRNADYKQESWTWYEGRWQTVIPGYGFTGVSTLAARYDNRPNVTYDWENATVFSGGLHLRWEGYAFFRSRNLGFIGPALRAMYVPRHRVEASTFIPPANTQAILSGSACQPGVVPGVNCAEKYEFEFQFGIIAGMQPNWVSSTDTLLVRAFTSAGPHGQLMGTHVFHIPLQLLVAYMVDIDF